MIFSTGRDAQIQTFDIFNRSHSYDSAFDCKRKRIDRDGGDPPGKGQDNPQPDRVGNEDEKDRDGPGGESADGDDEGEANCWGKVTSDFTSQRDGDGGGGQVFGQHASDPVGGDSDNETPREGVGNQDEDHPSDHADTVGPRFGSDEECAED